MEEGRKERYRVAFARILHSTRLTQFARILSRLGHCQETIEDG